MGTREACMPKGDMSANCKCRAVKAATPPRTVPDSNPPGHPTSTVSTVWETTASLGSFKYRWRGSAHPDSPVFHGVTATSIGFYSGTGHVERDLTPN